MCLHTNVHTQPHRQHPPLRFSYTSAVQLFVMVWLLPPLKTHHLQMAGAGWMNPVLPWQSLSRAGNHIHRCTHTPPHLYFLICQSAVGNEGTTMDTQNRGSKAWRSHTLTHTHRDTQNREWFLPSFNPRRDNHHTCAKHTYSTLPPACNLHLGKGIFHLDVTAAGQACIPTHTDTCTLFLTLHLPLLLSFPSKEDQAQSRTDEVRCFTKLEF